MAAQAFSKEQSEKYRVAVGYTPITAKSDELASLLEVGYGMKIADAQEIVDARKKNPVAYPYDVGRKAEALLAAFSTNPKVVATREKYKRRESIESI